MITPADIQNKEFAKGFRGYDVEEVDVFLDLITLDLEKLIKENLNLKAQVAALEKEKHSIGGTDLTVKDTLETAKAIMDDLAISSEKRAKALVQNAEMDAAIIIKDAKMKAEQVAAESKELTKSFENFKAQYKELLDRAVREFEQSTGQIDIDRLSVLLNEKNTAPAVENAVEPAVESVVERDTVNIEQVQIRESQDDIDAKKTMINIKYD